jgi:hypothetical protein
MLNIVGMSGFAFGDVQQIDPAAVVAILFDGLVLPPPSDAATSDETHATTTESSAVTNNETPAMTDEAEASTNDDSAPESSRPGYSKESTC